MSVQSIPVTTQDIRNVSWTVTPKDDTAGPWTVALRLGGHDGIVGDFSFDFQRSPGKSRFDRLSQTLMGGCSPLELQRIPWAKAIGIAEAALRWQLQVGAPRPVPDSEDLAEQIREALGADRPRRPPGPNPKGEIFYRTVAHRIKTLIAGGCKRPIAQLADESGYDRREVTRWKNEAQRRGYLPEGRLGPPSLVTYGLRP